MEQDDFLQMYERLAKERRELKDRRTELETELGDLTKRIESLTETIEHLAPLAGQVFFPENLANFGITDAIRHTLSTTARFSVAEIKKRMEEKGFDFSSYSAPSSSISTILRRLVDAGKATVEKEEWKVFYKSTEEMMPF